MLPHVILSTHSSIADSVNRPVFVSINEKERNGYFEPRVDESPLAAVANLLAGEPTQCHNVQQQRVT